MTKKGKKIKGGKHKYILQLKIHFEKAAVYVVALHFFLEDLRDWVSRIF